MTIVSARELEWMGGGQLCDLPSPPTCLLCPWLPFPASLNILLTPSLCNRRVAHVY